ncbi:MAG: G8 domain-containing protein, partial [Phormidesmis sp.]
MSRMAHSPDHAALDKLIAGATPTHTAVKSGAWSDPTTWSSGKVPGNDAKVFIGEGFTVTYDQIGMDRLKTIAIEGDLKFAADQDTQLYVETILNSEKGKLDIGSANQPIAADKITRIIFTSDSSIDTQWDPTQLSKGLVSHGEVNIFGADKLDKIELTGDATAGSNSLTFKQSPSGWQVGDKIVLGGTSYGWNGNDQDNSRLQDEVLTITSISGNQVSFVNDDIKGENRDVLRFDHLRSPLAEASETSLYAANLTRNVSFETENGKAVPIDHRAHVMLMHNPNVKVVNAGFYDLGRSDKTKLVDDIGKNVDGSNGNGTNVRGRYALHLHKTGVEDSSSPASLVEGNVVSGSPGWGIVQHESKADLKDNVVFDVVGSGIVAESGNELGSWTDNIVIKTTGIKQESIAAQETAREQRFDLGFKGEGFWIQGAAMIENKGNTAISSNDTGMSLFGGALDIDDPSFFRPISTVKISQLPTEIQKLFPAGQTEVDIRDIPMATVEGFQAYNNLYGLDVWGHSTNFDGEVYFSSDGDGPLPDTAHLGRSQVKDFKLWGNRWIGAKVQYSSNVDLKNGLILGAGNEKVTGGSGLFSNHAAFNAVYDNLSIAGFRQGAQIEYPNSDKDFIATTLKNSTFEGNSYNLNAVGDENDNDSRPDDFGSFLKLDNNQFAAPNSNRAPTAQVDSQAAGGLAVTLDASASSDADPLLPEDGTPRDLASKGIAAYGWDLNNDGTIDRFGRVLNHVFDSAGRKEISLTVVDDQGQATTVKQTIDVQPSAYGNAFAGGDFNSDMPVLEPWKSSSEYSDEGWYVHGDSKITDGVAQLSKPGGWNGFVGQVARNEKVHRGAQTLSFRMKKVEGAPESSYGDKNKVTVT